MERLANLIHVAKILDQGGRWNYLFLRKIDPHHFRWFQETSPRQESETAVSGAHVEEAIRLGRAQWKERAFTTLICGFRFTLPERDEHGMNALFHQMAASYASMNGIYFDNDLGANCIVHQASNEARALWKRLKEHA